MRGYEVGQKVEVTTLGRSRVAGEIVEGAAGYLRVQEIGRKEATVIPWHAVDTIRSEVDAW